MFSFFRKKSAGKPEAERSRNTPSAAVDARAPRRGDATNEQHTQKDVVNLLLPSTDYAPRGTVGSLLQNIMPRKKRRNRRISRAQSCREISPPTESQRPLQRSNSGLDSTYKREIAADVTAPTLDGNTRAECADAADFVKALVLQKYANKAAAEPKRPHVSLVYVNEPNLDEKRHAESLLREIAKSIDCTIDEINDNTGMGANDSKERKREPVYETIDEPESSDPSIAAFKDDLKDELQKLLQEQNGEMQEKTMDEDAETPKKSNLKPPRSDTEGCSDDDRSDCGKKRVTFRKRVIFDDGEEQTDEELDSSFESLTSGEEDFDSPPDNDELLGGVVVSRSDDNKTVIENCNTDSVRIIVEHSDDQRISSDNSDSGFLDINTSGSNDDLSDVKTLEVSESDVSDSDTESEVSECDDAIVEEAEENEDDAPAKQVFDEDRISIIEVSDTEDEDSEKTLVTQESKFQTQVSALTELADARCGEAERARDVICQYRKEIEERDLEIERLKCELAKAYKESELVRQRSRSLEDELDAARTCSADLAAQLSSRNDEELLELRAQLEAMLARRDELEARVLVLERDRDRLEQERRLQEQKAAETLEAAEANTTKWRLAHEAARSQAAARAERMLADCEWKTRELERRARDAERRAGELTESLEQVKAEKSQPSAAHMAELTQLRSLATEQQRSVQSLTLQLQKVETREEALKLESHRLKELLEKEIRIGKDKENRHYATVERLEQQHTKALETIKSENAAAAASARAILERNHAERTRNAMSQLRAEAERDAKNADRKLREITTRFDNLKELLATKEAQFETAIAEANSKTDWELLQLRHMLDKSDITYANNVEKLNDKYQKEKDQLTEEWTEKLKNSEEQATQQLEEARQLLETTKTKLTAERNDQINKLKDQHRKEMEEQWENFMSDKEHCLARMKAECRQEGEEERVKREKDLMEELAELRALIHSKGLEYENLTAKAASCARTLAVTEQELREALERERELREKRSEDATRTKQMERAAREQVEHLNRKCACLRKLFDDLRAKLVYREQISTQSLKEKDKEIAQLKGEVARLTKLLMGQSSPRLGARTRADGCEGDPLTDEGCLTTAEPRTSEATPAAPRRKGGTVRTPEVIRKRPTLPELPALPPEARLTVGEEQNGRRRANSVELPAVQVPTRIKQLQERTTANN